MKKNLLFFFMSLELGLIIFIKLNEKGLIIRLFEQYLQRTFRLVITWTNLFSGEHIVRMH